MKFGDVCTGTVTGMDEKGRGIIQGSRTFVIPFTTPGDEVSATFIRRDKGTGICRLAEIIKPSEDRITAPCPHAGSCGGCLWQHVAYPAQLRIKQSMINSALAKAGHEERVGEVQASHDLFSYRNRMDYAVGWKGEVGLKGYGTWNKYYDLSTCYLLDQDTPRILQAVRDLMRDFKIEPWDAKFQRGNLRYCIIRRGVNTNERLITLVVKDLSQFTDAIKQEILLRFSPFCTSLFLGENPEVTDISLCRNFELLRGQPYLTEEVNGIFYRIHPNSFFQTNTHMAAELQKTVLNAIGELTDKHVLDLYCGMGFFGVACAKAGATVYGHEIDAQAIELAKANAEVNGVTERTRFRAGPVEELLWRKENPDAVIIDPPRAGLHPNALHDVLKNKPPIVVYVSCNFHRFAEELQTLKKEYRVTDMKALDMFPHTPHVELVTKLIRKDL
ncbi:MAG: 23S rRNA (uracil(1939)-C(5))-methyltransferase RlmD [Patescibacteria group bacterium]